MIGWISTLIKAGKLKRSLMHANKVGKTIMKNSILLEIKLERKPGGYIQFGENQLIPLLGLSKIKLFLMKVGTLQSEN